MLENFEHSEKISESKSSVELQRATQEEPELAMQYRMKVTESIAQITNGQARETNGELRQEKFAVSATGQGVEFGGELRENLARTPSDKKQAAVGGKL